MSTNSKSDPITKIDSLEKRGLKQNSPNNSLNNPSASRKENSLTWRSPSKIYEKYSKSTEKHADGDNVLGNSSSKPYIKTTKLPEFLKIKVPYGDTDTKTSWTIQIAKTISSASPEKQDSNKCIAELQEIANSLSSELHYCLNQKHILKREISYARAVAKREIFSDLQNFADLYKKAVEGKWKGRQELILHLKEKIHNLTRLVEQKEKDLDIEWPNGKNVPFVEFWKNPIEIFQPEPLDYASYLEEEKEGLIAEKQLLKEKLEYFIAINEDLAEEVNYLKKETSKKISNSSVDLHQKLRELKIRIKYCLDNKSQLIKSLTTEEYLTYKLVKEVAELKNQTQKETEIVEDSKKRLESLKSDFNDDNNTHRVVEEARNHIMDIAKQSVKFFEDMAREYHQQLNRLRLFVNIDNDNAMFFHNPKQLAVSDRLSVAQDSKSWGFNNIKLPPIAATEKPKKVLRFRSPLTSEINVSTTTKAVLGYRLSLVDSFYKVKFSYKRYEESNLDRSVSLYVSLEKVSNKLSQFLESKSILFNLVLKIKILNFMYKQLCDNNTGLKAKSGSDKRSIAHPRILDAARIFYFSLKDENKFLHYCIDRVYRSKEDDLDFLITGSSEIENLFRRRICA